MSESTTPHAASPTPGQDTRRAIFELVQVAAITLAIVLPVRYFLVQPFYVKGASMEPNFEDHEYLVIDELSYRFKDPQRGDSVVFRYDLEGPSATYLIKRVIGLPGETVQVGGGQIKIFNQEHPNGFVLKEDYLSAENQYTVGSRDVKLGTDEYYVLGDNRLVSKDSRIFGPIRRESIVGRVWLRGWPVNRWSTFPGITYPESLSTLPSDASVTSTATGTKP